MRGKEGNKRRLQGRKERRNKIRYAEEISLSMLSKPTGLYREKKYKLV